MKTPPKEIPPLTESDKIRFWEKIDRFGPQMPGVSGRCWLWTASKFGDGYGKFHLCGKMHQAHRIAFVLGGGAFTEVRSQANHRCGNRPCCNPDHLYAGTNQENMDDKLKDGTVTFGEKNGQCKLTDAQCVYIRSSPLNNSALSRELGVSRRQISVIKRGEQRTKTTTIPK